MEKKILILILASNQYPSPINEFMQKSTWIKEKNDTNIEILFYKASDKTKIKDDYLYLKQDDFSVTGIAQRTIEAFDWSLRNKDFDYIFRINSSSYINLRALREFAISLENKYIYSGRKMLFHDQEFVSGAGILLNKNCVNLLVKNKNKLDKNYLDDVAFGKLLKQLDVKIIPTDYQVFSNNIYKEKINTKNFQFRCNMFYFGYPRYLETLVFRKIHKTFKGNSDNFFDFILYLLINLLKIFNLNFIYLRYIKKSNSVKKLIK